MRLDLPAPGADGGSVPSVRAPMLLSDTPLSYGQAAPRLGEQTGQVLAGLGFAQDEILRLAEAGTVQLHSHKDASK